MKILKWIDDNLEIYLVNFLLANIAVWVFIQVVLRYIFSYSLPWSEELVRWSFVWLIWVGISYGFKVRKHVAIDFLVNKMPQKLRLIIDLIINLIILWCMIKLAVLGTEQILNPIIAKQNSIVLYWPFTDTHVTMLWLYASLPVGAFLSTIRVFQNIYADIKTALVIFK